MMKNHVYLAAAISLSCATEPVVEMEDMREGGVMAIAAAPPPHAAPSGEEIEARIAERMAAAAEESRIATAALPSVHGTHVMRTHVQEALGVYSDCFSELPARRHTCRRQFNRRMGEAALIRRMGNSNHDLLDVTRLVLGRIILSEANWAHDERRDRYFPEQNHAEIDAPAIYQVLRHTRRNGETLLGAMRRHAPHVSEARAITGRLTQRRMAWVSHLQLNCNEPSGFPALDHDGAPMQWGRDYRPRCESLFVLAQRLLDGGADVLGPWADAPLVTWGGRCEDAAGACDDHLAAHRGLVPFEAPSGPLTANRFWCRPGPGCEGPPLEVAVAEVN
jgi:hypothetical protein